MGAEVDRYIQIHGESTKSDLRAKRRTKAKGGGRNCDS